MGWMKTDFCFNLPVHPNGKEYWNNAAGETRVTAERVRTPLSHQCKMGTSRIGRTYQRIRVFFDVEVSAKVYRGT